MTLLQKHLFYTSGSSLCKNLQPLYKQSLQFTLNVAISFVSIFVIEIVYKTQK